MKITKREFLKLSGAAVCAGALQTEAAEPPKRWYKGNLHSHTYWSDGGAPPAASERRLDPAACQSLVNVS